MSLDGDHGHTIVRALYFFNFNFITDHGLLGGRGCVSVDLHGIKYFP